MRRGHLKHLLSVSISITFKQALNFNYLGLSNDMPWQVYSREINFAYIEDTAISNQGKKNAVVN